MSLHVTIRRMILTGLPLSRRQAEQLKGSVASELQRLLEADRLGHALIESGRWPAAIQANAIEIGNGSDADRLGRRIARSVYQGVTDGQSKSR